MKKIRSLFLTFCQPLNKGCFPLGGTFRIEQNFCLSFSHWFCTKRAGSAIFQRSRPNKNMPSLEVVFPEIKFFDRAKFSARRLRLFSSSSAWEVKNTEKTTFRQQNAVRFENKSKAAFQLRVFAFTETNFNKFSFFWANSGIAALPKIHIRSTCAKKKL